MATRSRIGIELKDGSILSAYHHWDGYPEWLGRILKTHYNTKEKVAELIDGGDMSTCWTDERWTGDRWGSYPTKVDEYGPQYYSQRGEDSPPVMHNDLNDFLVYTDDNSGGEYAYHFANGKWVCHQVQNYRDPNVVKEVSIPEGALAV
jgi:hypothetical protein